MHSDMHSIATAPHTRNAHTPRVEYRMVVDAWSARIAKCAVSQQPNANLNAFLSNSRTRAAQTRAQKRIPLPRLRAFGNARTPCVTTIGWSTHGMRTL
eukprot:3038912-Lingulodinium_polyedra.AAC.1